jgi:hypothetical protein
MFYVVFLFRHGAWMLLEDQNALDSSLMHNWMNCKD